MGLQWSKCATLSYMSIEKNNTLEKIRAIESIEVSPEETYDAAHGSDLVPTSLGATFLDYDIQKTLEWQRDPEFKNWPLKSKLEQLTQGATRSKAFASIFFHTPEFRSLIEEADREGGLEEKWGLLRQSKADSHLARLLTHEGAPACTEFAAALFENIGGYDHVEEDEPSYIPNDDSISTQTFWTFAPYIYHNLLAEELTPAEAIQATMEWSRARVGNYNKDGELAQTSYPGLSGRPHEVDFRLRKSGQHLSHQLANKVGLHIANKIRPVYKKPYGNLKTQLQ